jgi:hypothetical protein
MQIDLHKPIGVFDAGIGSYGIVEVIRRHYPHQDVLTLPIGPASPTARSRGKNSRLAWLKLSTRWHGLAPPQSSWLRTRRR